MRKILTLTMSGLVTVLPLALTVYVIYWLRHGGSVRLSLRLRSLRRLRSAAEKLEESHRTYYIMNVFFWLSSA